MISFTKKVFNKVLAKEKLLAHNFSKKLKNLKFKYVDGFSKKSYSMEGEDILLGFFFDMIDEDKKGFFVDIGAHHPNWLSNTYFFYKRGWSGINIDPLPGCMRLFNKIRARDINLEIAISDKKEVLSYYYYDKPEYNTFSEDLKDRTTK